MLSDCDANAPLPRETPTASKSEGSTLPKTTGAESAIRFTYFFDLSTGTFFVLYVLALLGFQQALSTRQQAAATAFFAGVTAAVNYSAAYALAHRVRQARTIPHIAFVATVTLIQVSTGILGCLMLNTATACVMIRWFTSPVRDFVSSWNDDYIPPAIVRDVPDAPDRVVVERMPARTNKSLVIVCAVIVIGLTSIRYLMSSRLTTMQSDNGRSSLSSGNLRTAPTSTPPAQTSIEPSRNAVNSGWIHRIVGLVWVLAALFFGLAFREHRKARHQ